MARPHLLPFARKAGVAEATDKKPLRCGCLAGCLVTTRAQSFVASLQAPGVSLAADGARGLLLGGIAAANLFMVSVTEWTTEINVRMAVGTGIGLILAQLLMRALMGAFVQEHSGSLRDIRARPGHRRVVLAPIPVWASLFPASGVHRLPSHRGMFDAPPRTRRGRLPRIRHPTGTPETDGVRSDERPELPLQSETTRDRPPIL
jgi:hypothetical protein